MADIVTFKTGHPLVGSWVDADRDYGTSVQFTVRAAGAGFEVGGIDTHDGEELTVSDVRWDGRVLRFTCVVPSTANRIEYQFEVVAPSEVIVRYTKCERWVRAQSTT